MSFTAVFTECRNGDRPPLIRDLKGLKAALKEGFDCGDTLARIMVTDTRTEGEYPKQEYQELLGFRTWKEDIVELLNLERIGYGYSHTHEWASIFAVCSRFTEPFIVFHSPDPNTFPFLPDYLAEDPVIFKATCAAGRCTVEEIRFSASKPKFVQRMDAKEDAP